MDRQTLRDWCIGSILQGLKLRRARYSQARRIDASIAGDFTNTALRASIADLRLATLFPAS
ncbi:hypothetical protein MPLDJ20_20073 [Mesorhizobium plurifarium]|uniref:Uncharacterized protein n=1 Tax=Mesorhizobium plurifarium TaxID=69974 RepID=A0A090GKB4_MESPL|nr:hypothetical protein MPLDJ20_20073 [Mesorhizobium plurifarium]CDX38540.1 hypothetical protein MPLSOD_330064 [Mesorhizobium sp. SOD10]